MAAGRLEALRELPALMAQRRALQAGRTAPGRRARTPVELAQLLEDLSARGHLDDTLVVWFGDFGRTPKISYVASSGGGVASGPEGTVQPGRDHWPQCYTVLLAGGGVKRGYGLTAFGEEQGSKPRSAAAAPPRRYAARPTIMARSPSGRISCIASRITASPSPVETPGSGSAEIVAEFS